MNGYGQMHCARKCQWKQCRDKSTGRPGGRQTLASEKLVLYIMVTLLLKQAREPLQK